jgi:hypothetical protein
MTSEYIKERPKSVTHAVPSPWMSTLGWSSRLNYIKDHREGRTYPIEVTMDDIVGVNFEEY